MKKLPIILDCDPGVDDSIALFMLYKYKELFDIKLMISEGGNVGIDLTTNNLCFFVKNYFKGVKVCKGYDNPMDHVYKKNASYVHGENGLGNLKIDKQDIKYEEDVIKCIYDVLNESSEKISVITIGPTTNVGMFLKIYPEYASKIDCIYAMIGSINGKGNITSEAEFNAYYDPKAFKVLLDSNIKLVINPIELGESVLFKKETFLNRNVNTNTQVIMNKIVEGIVEPFDDSVMALYDVFSIHSLIKKEYYEFINCDIVFDDVSGKCELKDNSDSKHCYLKCKDIKKCKKDIEEALFSIQ